MSIQAAAAHTILIVEDDSDIREALAQVLLDEGYEVVEATQGAEALAHLRGGLRPCLILLDLMMPVLNGWQFRAEQKADPQLRDLPVVVISADTSAHREASKLEVAAFLQKPVELDELLALVARVCGQPSPA